MIAGPEILSAMFLATSESWRSNSAAFASGAAVSITTIVILAFLLSTGAKKQGASGNTLDIVFMVLMIATGVHTFMTRKTSTRPTWMGKLGRSTPKGLVQARVPAPWRLPDRHPHLDRRGRLGLTQR